MPPRVSLSALAAFSLAMLCAPLAAQEAASRLVISPADSARLLAAARSDQASFERYRRNHLPESWGGSSSRCDERIGRFCLTHSSNRTPYIPPPEDEGIVNARLGLLDSLEQVGALITGDEWVVGQRVRYLVEAGRLGQAVDAARSCTAEGWWCAALGGFALHYAADPLAADSAFSLALSEMPASEREDWLDLSLILNDRSVRVYRRMEEGDQIAFAERFWRLADPLLIQPGNELFAEHLSRHVHNQFQFRSRSPDAISWGYDLREILIRYGWPSGWQRVREWSISLSQGPPSLIGHYGGAPQDLLPPSGLLVEDGGELEWDVEDIESRTGYNLPLPDSLAKWFNPLDHQVAVFRRGGEAVVVGAYALPLDSLPENARATVGMGALMLDDLAAAPVFERLEDQPLDGSFSLRMPMAPMLVSIETIVPEDRRIARARHTVDLEPLLPGLIAMSDILLIDPGDQLPDSLDAAVPFARGRNEFGVGDRIGLYWEIYGAQPEEIANLPITVGLVGERPGWLRRLAERAGIVDADSPVRIRWSEPVTDAEYQTRSVAIDIPEVDPGTYELVVTLEPPGREPLSVRRTIEIIAPQPIYPL